jgi:hypothetical protein
MEWREEFEDGKCVGEGGENVWTLFQYNMPALASWLDGMVSWGSIQ